MIAGLEAEDRLQRPAHHIQDAEDGQPQRKQVRRALFLGFVFLKTDLKQVLASAWVDQVYSVRDGLGIIA